MNNRDLKLIRDMCNLLLEPEEQLDGPDFPLDGPDFPPTLGRAVGAEPWALSLPVPNKDIAKKVMAHLAGTHLAEVIPTFNTLFLANVVAATSNRRSGGIQEQLQHVSDRIWEFVASYIADRREFRDV